MRLLKIGRDASNDIVLHSDKVSTLHAEITLLDSGDIQLEDKNSRNGTYIMNQRIAPGKPVNVRRGDAIRFADVELQWSQVPMPEDNSAYKGIFGIGSNFNNDLQISGATVSRYHATAKLGRDGKMYIVDHSKNGTTVDGVKIMPNTPYRIKKKSAVVCGGVPVDTSRLPWPSNPWKYVLGIAAALVVVAGVGFGVWKLTSNQKPSIQALQEATVCVIEQYYIEVTFKDDPFIGRIDNWPEKWIFGLDSENNLALGTMTNIKIRPLGGRGTAFFISKDGELGTNRHIACPWAYLTNDEKDGIRQQIVLAIKDKTDPLKSNVDYSKALLSAFGDALSSEQQKSIKMEIDNIDAYLTRILRSDYEISGSFEYLGIALKGSHISTIADMLACQVIDESGDPQKDCALLRLNAKKHTPEEIIKGGFFDIEKARLDEMSLKPQEEEFITIGYPAQFGIDNDFVGKGQEILPTIHRTYISKMPDDNMFQLQSNIVGGQSGSPIIDKNHALVGIVWGSHRGTDVAYACNIKHLKELYDKNKSRIQ